ncbi:CARD- and ANK-domain containing inflammasome adapter protein-like [Clytia hemisphaerica]|uniref:Uncharacterized protein n=1 Tax=Clytia hemisphaerica TaxID=252671 RepID=A0A7M5XHF4_9CNID
MENFKLEQSVVRYIRENYGHYGDPELIGKIDVEKVTKVIIHQSTALCNLKKHNEALKSGVERSDQEKTILYKFVKLCVEKTKGSSEDVFQLEAKLIDLANKTFELLMYPSSVISARFGRMSDTILHFVTQLKYDTLFMTELLHFGADINAQNTSGQTPLSLAVSNYDYDAMEMMLSNVSSVDMQKTLFQTVCFIPVRISLKQIAELFEFFKRYGFDMNLRNESQISLLEHYISSSRRISLKVVKYLVNNSHASCLRKRDGSSLIQTLIKEQSRQDPSVLEYLCKLDEQDINKRDGEQMTPLINAITKSSVGNCKVLLEAGAHIDIVYNQGMTCLHYAVSVSPKRQISGHEIIVHLLLEKGASVDTVDCYGDPPIVYAAATGNIKILKILYEKHKQLGGEVNDQLIERMISLAELHGHDQMIREVEKLRDPEFGKPNKRYCKCVSVLYHWPASKRGYLGVSENVLQRQIAQQKKKKISLANDTYKDWLKRKVEDTIFKEKYGPRPLIFHKFFVRDERLKTENLEMERQLTELLDRIAEFGKSIDPNLSLKPILSGSNTEGTKIGLLDEIDFLCHIEFPVKLEYKITKDIETSNLKRIEIKNAKEMADGMDELSNNDSNGKSYLSTEICAHRLWKVFVSCFKHDEIWEGLNLSMPWWEKKKFFEPSTLRFISTTNFIWNSQNVKMLTISIDLVPTLLFKDNEEKIQENPPSETFRTLTSFFDISENETLLVSKIVHFRSIDDRVHSVMEEIFFVYRINHLPTASTVRPRWIQAYKIHPSSKVMPCLF